MSLSSKLQSLEDGISTGIDQVYDGLNRPDYNMPPKLGGDSPAQINSLVALVMAGVAAAVALGIYCDRFCRGKAMEGRPRFWAIFLLLASYLLLIPGLINPVFSFSIVVNVLGHRKPIEPEAGHEVCTETTTGLAHLLYKTGSHIGAYLVILFSMVIPALELIMLILGELFRFTSATCADIFRYVILWVQHRSKWASPDMFAYVLLVNLVRTLDHEPLILSRGRLEIGFSCFSTFVVTATVASLGVPLPKVGNTEDHTQPLLLRCLGERGILLATITLAIIFVPLFAVGLYMPCMAFRIELKQLFPPYGPLPESAKPALAVLDLKDLLDSNTSVLSSVWALVLRLPALEANTFIALALLAFCVVGATLFDMVLLVLAAVRLSQGKSYTKLDDANSSFSSISIARVLKKLSMLDVAMVGVYLVTVCMSMYKKYGIEVSVQNGTWILVAAEVVHSITYYIVDTAVGFQESTMERQKADALAKDGEEDEEADAPRFCLGCGSGGALKQQWLWSQQGARKAVELQ